MTDRSAPEWTVFAFLWAAAMLLGMGSRGLANTPLEAVVTLCALATCLRPARPELLGGTALAWLAHRVVDPSSYSFIHHFLVSIGCLAILGALGLGWRRGPAEWGASAWGLIAPVGSAIATVAMLAAGFSKLNQHFLDPEVSCAVILMAWHREFLPFIPDAPWVDQLSMLAPVVSELGGPLLMLHPRTRRLGWVLLMPLMLMLGLNGSARLYEFTAPFIALFALRFQAEPLLEAARRLPLRALSILGAVAVVGGMLVDRHPLGHGLVDAITLLAFILIFGGAVALVAVGGSPAAPRPAPRLRLGCLALLPLGLLMHETLPYLGLGTARNFRMAGNHSVSTLMSNHLVVRSVPDLGINRLAQIVRIDRPVGKMHTGSILPIVALEDLIARHPRLEVVYYFEGEVVEVLTPEAHKAYPKRWWVEALEFDPARPYRDKARCGHAAPGEVD